MSLKWSPREDAVLREKHLAMSWKAIRSLVPGRSYRAVRSRAMVLKLSRITRWTRDEDKVLRGSLNLDSVVVAHLLRRTRAEVHRRASVLGLSFKVIPPKGPYLTATMNGKSDRVHRILAAAALGRKLPPGAHIHHHDGRGHNNEKKNLVICQDAAYHKLLHYRARVKIAGGNPNTDYLCSRCGPARQESFTWRSTGGPGDGVRHLTYCRPCHKIQNAKRSKIAKCPDRIEIPSGEVPIW